jgi:hypothetical protein
LHERRVLGERAIAALIISVGDSEAATVCQEAQCSVPDPVARVAETRVVDQDVVGTAAATPVGVAEVGSSPKGRTDLVAS